ncbi:ribonuclease [Enterocloster bolteae]|uniref:ribonuclease n=1 Tax=Enterocloster bolteae TaxID=208479 RepID=UPI002A830E19|nr:ribonuclease [Enterocloster bolteae]
METNVFMQYISYLLIGIGILACVVSIITQVIKELPKLDKLPTSVVALTISLVLCPLVVIVLCTYMKQPIVWYYVFGAFIAAFIVYLVSTGGWERVNEIWKRTRYGGLADRK